MTISGTDITTFNLKLLALDSFYNLPRRKRIYAAPIPSSPEPREAKTATVTLLGKYADVADMLTNVNAFETLLKSDLKHAIDITEHDITVTGVFASGYELIPFVGGKVVKIIAQITIV